MMKKMDSNAVRSIVLLELLDLAAAKPVRNDAFDLFLGAGVPTVPHVSVSAVLPLHSLREDVGRGELRLGCDSLRGGFTHGDDGGFGGVETHSGEETVLDDVVFVVFLAEKNR